MSGLFFKDSFTTFSILSSRNNPLMITRSALLNFTISDGTGSKVCEFTPSGTNPVRFILSPAIFLTILVIGDTDVMTFNVLLAA